MCLGTALWAPTAEAAQFSLNAYGDFANKPTDAAPAINRAISAAIAAGSGNEVLIPSGRYRLSTSIRISRADGLVVRGETGVTLVMDDGSEIVNITDCSRLTLESLSFDRKQFCFTQGTVTAVDLGTVTCTVTIDAGYDPPDAPQLAKAGFYPFLHPESGTYQLDKYISQLMSWEKIGDGQWRLHFDVHGHAPDARWAGKRFFLWAGSSGHCIVGRGLKDCLFEDINYWGGGGNAGLYLGPLSGTNVFRRFVVGVPPGSDRIFSCAGGGQIGDIRGKLLFDNCEFTKIDDDGLDLLGTWTRVLEQKEPRSLIVQNDKDFRAGDHVAIWDWPEKRSRTEAVIVAAKPNPDQSVTLTLDRDVTILRAGPGDGQPFGYAARDDGIDRIINLDTVGDETVIRNCRFQSFRAKCLNLKARNCTVENCTFSDSWTQAIGASPEWYFQEGPAIRHLIIRNNRFVNCNHSNIEIGAGPSTGYNVPVRASGASRDSVDILIEGNSFTGYGKFPSVFSDYVPVGNAIRVQNARGVVIRDNTFTRPAVSATNLADVLIFDSDEVVQK
jgi:hypothetical protein